MKGVYVIIPVWGERYVRRWLDLSLPSLLADGNLPALARQFPVRTLLFTTQEDLGVIMADPRVKMLRDIGPLRVRAMIQNRKDALAVHAGSLMTGCHKAGLQQSWADDFGIIPVCSDLIFANGSLGSLAPHIAAGKRAVITQGFGVVEDKLVAQLDALGLRGGPTLDIPPRTLVRMLFDTFHPAFSSKFWDAPNCSSHPAMMYWRLGERSFLMRCWHLYPVFFYPDRKVLMRGSLDDDMLGVCLSDPENQIAVLDDSDECMVVDAFDPNKTNDMHAYQVMSHPFSVEFVTAWAAAWARPMHCDNVSRYKFWMHADDLDREAWRHVEKESDGVIDQILANVRSLNRPTGTALL